MKIQTNLCVYCCYVSNIYCSKFLDEDVGSKSAGNAHQSPARRNGTHELRDLPVTGHAQCPLDGHGRTGIGRDGAVRVSQL